MKKNIIGISLVILFVTALLSFNNERSNRFSTFKKTGELQDLSVMDILVELGEKKQNHYLLKTDADSVKMGYEMVHFGQLKDKSNKRISKFFVCTDCHNQVKETKFLSDVSAEARITYGIENDIPFLPASTFFGMYNKEHWYNGDYAKKYGELVEPTRDSLSNAIQLCAVQCSQGRSLENWEIRSILHYYKSIEIKVRDLNLSQPELNQLLTDLAVNNSRSVKMLKGKYQTINDAKFGDLHPKEPKNYSPNLANGKYIYDNGCLHCHGMGKDITNFEFDADKLTFSFLESKLDKGNHYTVPYIVRKGTYAVGGHRQYMPQYPLQKMSDSQLYDLINYIKSKSEK